MEGEREKKMELGRDGEKKRVKCVAIKMRRRECLET